MTVSRNLSTNRQDASVLLVGLSHRNMRASVAALARRGYRIEELKSFGAGVRSLSGTGAVEPAHRTLGGPLWLPATTRRILGTVGPDTAAIIAAGGGTKGRDAVLAARILRLPIVLRTQFDVHWDASAASPWERVAVTGQRTLESLVMRLSGATRISPSLGSGASRRHGGIRFLPHAVEVTLAEPPALSARPLRVLTITRCPASKNNAGLLDLAERVAPHDIAFTVVFGEGPECPKCAGRGRDELELAIRDRGLANLALVGPLDGLTDLYRAHHVVLRNSLSEGANVTVIEGAAEGCVPIVSATSGAGQGLFDDGAGFLVDAHDVDRQAAILVELLGDVPSRERLRAAVLAVVKERCDPERFADLVEETIARRGPRRSRPSGSVQSSSSRSRRFCR